MSTTITNVQVLLSIIANLQGGGSPANLQALVDHTPSIDLGIGSAAGEVQICYSGPISVVSGTPFALNLITGLDPIKNPMGISELVGWLLENDSTTGGQNLVVGGGTHPAMGSDQLTVFPGVAPTVGVGGNLNPTGWTVTSGSSDTFTVTSASGTIAGKLTLFGR